MGFQQETFVIRGDFLFQRHSQAFQNVTLQFAILGDLALEGPATKRYGSLGSTPSTETEETKISFTFSVLSW